MKIFKKILIGLLVVFLLIQFIQPAKNTGHGASNQDITRVVAIPTDVQTILKASCYDCHSNNTNYPWYSNVQPFGFWLAHHIKEGKAELNFNDFSSYSKRRQLSKLKAIAESIQDGSMPLSSYTLIHQSAKLSGDDKKIIMDWAGKAKDSLTMIYEQ